MSYATIEIPFTGEQLKQAGMKLAEETADSKESSWNIQCFEMLKKFLDEKKDVPFRAEEFRHYCELRNLPAPASKRVFGSVIFKARAQGLIEHIGFTQTHDKKSHRANCSLWINKLEH